MSILTEFLRRPLTTGAIAASSPALARRMTGGLGLERARTVVELGPGTGVVTDEILRRVAPGTRVVAVELNGRLAERLTRRYEREPVEIVPGSAADLTGLALDPVDVVVSGLPWTVMAAPVRARILDAVTAVLAPDGMFATFAYAHAAWTPPARRFAGELGRRFAVTATSRLVWRNLPPAFVHRAAGPLPVRTPRDGGGTRRTRTA
ncbi:class I SAM-dependent methyltransferase [Dactylosporangium sp. CS-033363]|uniref:class I SAM-dependent methyltransferase n=1 Tax=Dactylosporangium sp. CS-033363 TaxID=3239935 RepID=UPI003D8C99AC